jgi:hypothetical protein
MMSETSMNTGANEMGKDFLEFRKKMQRSELLSSSMERLLGTMRFSGRLSVVVQNGRVLKTGYEEGYFRKRGE